MKFTKPLPVKEVLICWQDHKGGNFSFESTKSLAEKHKTLLRNNPYVKSFEVKSLYAKKEQPALL